MKLAVYMNDVHWCPMQVLLCAAQDTSLKFRALPMMSFVSVVLHSHPLVYHTHQSKLSSAPRSRWTPVRISSSS